MNGLYTTPSANTMLSNSAFPNRSNIPLHPGSHEVDYNLINFHDTMQVITVGCYLGSNFYLTHKVREFERYVNFQLAQLGIDALSDSLGLMDMRGPEEIADRIATACSLAELFKDELPIQVNEDTINSMKFRIRDFYMGTLEQMLGFRPRNLFLANRLIRQHQLNLSVFKANLITALQNYHISQRVNGFFDRLSDHTGGEYEGQLILKEEAVRQWPGLGFENVYPGEIVSCLMSWYRSVEQTMSRHQ
jgi:hypothetical protein